jgi:hypothetical protein
METLISIFITKHFHEDHFQLSFVHISTIILRKKNLYFELEMKRLLSTEFVTPHSPKNHTLIQPSTDSIEKPQAVEKYIWLDEIKQSSVPPPKKKHPLGSESRERTYFYHLNGHVQFGLKGKCHSYCAGKYRSRKYAEADQSRFVEALKKNRTNGEHR